MESDHAQIIGSPQQLNYHLIFIGVRFQKPHILSFEIFLNKQIGLFGNPLRQWQSELHLYYGLHPCLFLFACCQTRQ